MIKRATRATLFNPGDGPYPVRTHYLKDTYVDEKKGALDATNKLAELTIAVFAYVKESFTRANINFTPNKSISLWFSNLRMEGSSYALSRHVGVIIQDFESFQTLHVLHLGWRNFTRVSERHKNFATANYLHADYQTIGPKINLQSLTYCKMAPVLAGTMLANQGYSTQDTMVRITRPNEGKAFVVDSESTSSLLTQVFRDRIFDTTFYPDTVVGFGLEGLTHYGLDPLIDTYSRGVISLADQFLPDSTRVFNGDLLSLVPLNPILT